MDYYQSPRISGEILDCSMPMSFDTYSNCSYGCVYCFSQFQRGIGGAKTNYLNKNYIKHVNVEKIKKLFLNNGEGTVFHNFIKNRITMQWGGLSDQFDSYEYKNKISLELLKFFKEIKYPISFSTKSAWVFRNDDYLKVFENTKDIWHFKISIITNDKIKAKNIEKGVASPQKRLENFSILKDLGNKTTLRLRPFIIGVSDPTYLDLIDAAAERGIYSISTEFLCLDTRAPNKEVYNTLSKQCGFDIVEFYKKHSHSSGYLRLNHNIKKPYIDKIIEKCNQYSLGLGISDAHLKTYGTLGSCCGCPDEFNYFKGQLTSAIMKGKINNSLISFNDLENIEYFKDIPILQAGNLIGNYKKKVKYLDFSAYDYIKEKWNKPKDKSSVFYYTDNRVIPIQLNNDNNVLYRIKT